VIHMGFSRLKLTWRVDSWRGDGLKEGALTAIVEGDKASDGSRRTAGAARDKTGLRGVADRDGAWNVA
jgi:hypothetical protein